MQLPKAYLRSLAKVKQQQELENQEIKNKVQLIEFNPLARSVPDMDSLNLDEIMAIKFSESGSRGAIFIQTSAGVFVIKLSGEVGVDYFLNRLSHEYGVPAPKMKFLGWDDEEMRNLKGKVQEASKCQEVLAYRLQHKLEVAFMGILEYIPGLPIYRFRTGGSKGLFTQKRLETIGKIYAFDVFLNNGDRYPLSVWRSPGNYENIILKFRPDIEQQDFEEAKINQTFDDFVAIDPTIVLKSLNNALQQQIFNNYYASVEQLLNDCVKDLQENTANSLILFKTFIFKHVGYQLSVEELHYVIRGLLKQISIIAEKGIQTFNQILESTKIPPNQDWQDIFNGNLNRVDNEFHSILINKFKQCMQQNQDIFSQL